MESEGTRAQAHCSVRVTLERKAGALEGLSVRESARASWPSQQCSGLSRCILGYILGNMNRRSMAPKRLLSV